MTWKDIKTITLQKMFSIDGDVITSDEATSNYVKAMPGAANEALHQLATNCRGITKRIAIDCTQEKTSATYDLAQLCDNYYRITEPLYAKKNGKYSIHTDYVMPDDKSIVLPEGAEYIISCKVYPEKITSSTPDEHVIELYPEEAAVIPLYVASQLYKDDDIGQSVQMLNEYLTRLEELSAIAANIEEKIHTSACGRFESKNGWC